MRTLVLAGIIATLIAPLAADTPLQRKQAAKARADKAATEQRKQHRESVKAQKETAKAVKKSGKKH